MVKVLDLVKDEKTGFIFPDEALQTAVESLARQSVGPGYNIPLHYDAMNGSAGSDVDFYVQQARKKQGSVLDLACGTGRFSIPIAKSGLETTGIDISSSMISHAREKTKRQNLKIDFRLSDIRLFRLQKKFDFIFCGFNSSQHLHEENEFVSFLECVKIHLAPQGTFIFDIFNPSVKMLSRDPSQRYPVCEYKNPEGDGGIKVWEYPLYDSSSQLSSFKYIYQLGDKN